MHFLADLPDLAVQLARFGAWLALMVVVFATLERIVPVRPSKLLRRQWAVDVGWYFVNSLAGILLLGPISVLCAIGIRALMPEQIISAAATMPLWARMVAAMIVGEIGFYWGHRWSHKIPLLWRFHAVHHSAEQLDFLVNTRGHPIDVIFTRLCGLVLLYATGLASPVGPNPTLIPALVLSVGAAWSFFIHSNLRVRLGPLEQIISSPAFHHWHHTLDDHKDHNFSSMLPFVDRLFGTFYLPKHWPAAYGTRTPVPETLLGQLLDPFAPVAAANDTAPRERTAVHPEPTER
ncbi:MAG: sterol desaturase family protein [Burkholderiaceae bacterium]